jgi:N-sulfoglucosamine sulfohydrolase
MRDWSYIFNAWSDGETVYGGENMSGLTFKAMQEAAETDPAVAARVKHVQYRVPEELYDRRRDPYCLKNLIADPAHADRTAEMKRLLDREMTATDDPLLPKFRGEGEVPPEWYVRAGW